MSNNTYRAKIKLKAGLQEVAVLAASYFAAKEMLEAQYGRGCILWGPIPVN